MKEKKNIDRLFQEKFKNFEAHPSDAVWNNIIAAQKKKEDRKVIPIWWRLGGIAAGLAILLGLGIFLLADTSSPEIASPIVLEDTRDSESSYEKSIKDDTPKRENKTSQVASSENEQSLDGTLSKESSEKSVMSSQNAQEKLYPAQKYTSSVVVNPQTNSLNTSQETPNPKESQNTFNTSVASIQNNKNTDSLSTVIDQNDKLKLEVSSTQVATATTPNDENKISPLETLNLNDDPPLEKDLVAEAEKIASIQNETISPTDDIGLRNRWDVGAVAAPVYYGNFGGSGLDPAFKDNDKSGEVNLSYGVQVSYAITPKLKVRSGVSNVDLSYNTNDLAFSVNSSSRTPIAGISFSQNGNRVAISDNMPSDLQAPPSLIPGPRPEFNTGSVQQQLNYIEVPVEAVYTISEKRLGISVIGGVSTLFLNNDEVLLISDNLNTSLGTSSGINDVSFTTNIGLGLDYKITEAFKFNVEPAFKYQINGFDDSVGEFKPYYLGVYTGFSYKF